MKIIKTFFFLVFLALALFPYGLQAQTTAQEASVSVTGEVKTPVTLTVSEMDKLAKTTIIDKDRDNQEHTYSGTELAVILQKAGVTLGEELKGENMVKYLLMEASDGYQVLFSLAEIDPAFSTKKIILANRKDGALLPLAEGPFRVIIESEKRKARYIRQVISLKIKYAN